MLRIKLSTLAPNIRPATRTKACMSRLSRAVSMRSLEMNGWTRLSNVAARLIARIRTSRPVYGRRKTHSLRQSRQWATPLPTSMADLTSGQRNQIRGRVFVEVQQLGGFEGLG